MTACATDVTHAPSKSLADPRACGEPTAIAQKAADTSAKNTLVSGIHVLDTGRSAFFARAALLEAAACSIEAQYYIWNADATGVYLGSRLLAAANRGVQVRLILDDINVGSRDSALAALVGHPNVEIQIYNPFAQRRGLAKVLDFMFEFQRLNRRMHIKSFTIDGAVTIVGGRNIGDEYFDANPHLNFRDRDVIAIGPVVPQVAAMFDAYWRSPLARPVAELAEPAATLDPGYLATQADSASLRITAIHGAPPSTQEQADDLLGPVLETMTWAPAELLFDPPPGEDQLAEHSVTQTSAQALRKLTADVQKDILIESAYLGVDEDTLANISVLNKRGVRIRALTNSLASNDVTANHAAYARSRPSMLRAGVELHELRPDAAACATLVQNADACVPPHVFGLHSKTFVMDRRLVYVGSFNMNLRSRYLNSESGLIIHSQALAARIAGDIEYNMQPGNSWRVLLDDAGRLQWCEDIAAESSKPNYDHEPEVSWWRRSRAAALAMLPLDKYF